MLLAQSGVNDLSPRLRSARDAAAYLGISERTLWTLGNRGEIRQVRFGHGHRKAIRYDQRDLDEWIERSKGGRRRG